MTRPVIVVDDAERELAAAEAWYEAQRPGLGSGFVAAISDAMNRIAANPHLAPLVTTIAESLGARRIFVKRFPYSVVFIEQGEELWVVAFAHQRKRPGYWRGRTSSPETRKGE